MAVTVQPIVNRVSKPLALATHNVTTGDRLVTPDDLDKVNKHNAAMGRRATTIVKKRAKAVAITPSENGVEALSVELHRANDQAMHPVTTAVTALGTTPVVAATIPTVPKRRRIEEVARPKVSAIVSVGAGPPKTNCQGCVHGGLLELKVMEPAHIKHYLKPEAFLEMAKCAGDCKLVIRDIHRASPKAKLFYCDETNKGFYAPNDDPTKDGLECALILCEPCHAIREVRYEQATKQAGTAHRRTSRRRTGR